MAVRGAPAIAIAAALGLAVELVNNGGGAQFETAAAARSAIKQQMDYLVTRCVTCYVSKPDPL
jgi:5-methylthioribose kinase